MLVRNVTGRGCRTLMGHGALISSFIAADPIVNVSLNDRLETSDQTALKIELE